MRKYIIYIVMLFSIISQVSHAKALLPQRDEDKPHTARNTWKYGISGSSGIFTRRVGAFVEYKLLQAIGIESGVHYFSNIYILEKLVTGEDYALLKAESIGLPVVARLYVSDYRQLSLYVGIQPGYVIGGQIGTVTKTDDPFELVKAKTNDISNYPKKDQFKKWQVPYLIGFDYETTTGFIWGLNYIDDRLFPLIESQKTYITWCATFSLGLNIGAWIH